MLNAEGQVKCTNVVVKVRSIELSLIAIYYAFEKLKHSMSQFLLLSSVAIVKGKLVWLEMGWIWKTWKRIAESDIDMTTMIG